MSFEIFSPIWSHVKENEKKIRKKSKIKNFEKQKKWSGDMVDRYLSPKFGINSFSGFRENDVDGRTDDGRTTTDDGRPRDDSSSAVQ